MPELTEDQKQQMKMAYRAKERISETWTIFLMYLSQDKRPLEALELAQAAVSVWADFQDNAEIEPPDIQRPDFPAELDKAMTRMFSEMNRVGKRGGAGMLSINENEGTAQFEPLDPPEQSQQAKGSE